MSLGVIQRRLSVVKLWMLCFLVLLVSGLVAAVVDASLGQFGKYASSVVFELFLVISGVVFLISPVWSVELFLGEDKFCKIYKLMGFSVKVFEYERPNKLVVSCKKEIGYGSEASGGSISVRIVGGYADGRVETLVGSFETWLMSLSPLKAKRLVAQLQV